MSNVRQVSQLLGSKKQLKSRVTTGSSKFICTNPRAIRENSSGSVHTWTV